MPTLKGFLRGALTCLAATGLYVPALACPMSASPEAAAALEARERATNESLLKALIERRAEIERTADASEDKRALLDRLDKRIAEVRSRME